MALLAQPIPITSMGEKLKIKDLLQDSSLRNSIDIIAVIVKIGNKVSSQMARGSVMAREIYLCDDSWAMVKLIARDFFAESSANFKADQVIYIKNVKPMKLRGHTVLATMPETLISPEVNTPEAISLRSWLTQNNLDFKQDGFKNLLIKKFINLSSKELDNKISLAGSSENLNKELQYSQSSQSANTASTSQTNGTDNIKNIVNVSDVAERKRKLHEEDINVKIVKIDLAAASEKNIAKNNEIINIESDDDSTEKTKGTVQKEVLEKEDDIEVMDEDKDSIVSETFSALMSVHSPLGNWSMEKDKYLINFLSKYCNKKLTDDLYLKLLEANPDVFQGFSVDELKTRAQFLANAKNYIYLLQLCGGKEIKNEKEKCMFIDGVEELRKSMKIKKIKKELSN